MKGLKRLLVVCVMACVGAKCFGDTNAILISADGAKKTVQLASLQRIDIVQGKESTTMTAVAKKKGVEYAGLRLVAFSEDAGLNSVSAPNDGIAVYPNPVVESLYINGADEGAEVVVMDANGRVVVRSKGAEVNVSALPSGLYLVQVGGLYARFIKK